MFHKIFLSKLDYAVIKLYDVFMNMKRKEQLKNAQKRYRERHQWGRSRINLFVSEKAHYALKENAHQLGMSQANYLDYLLLNKISTSMMAESKPGESEKEEGQGAMLHRADSAENISCLATQIEQMERALNKKNYWIERLTAVNESLNRQNQELVNRIQQLERANF